MKRAEKSDWLLTENIEYQLTAQKSYYTKKGFVVDGRSLGYGSSSALSNARSAGA